MAVIEKGEDILILGLIAAGVYAVYYFFTQTNLGQAVTPKQTTLGGANNQPGLTSGETASGYPYSVAKGSGAITIWPDGINGQPATYSQSSIVGPSGQTVAQLLGFGWTYSDVADYLGMSGGGIPQGAIA